MPNFNAPTEVSTISGHQKFQYRPDLDGLRALSVILVIFYHANIRFVPGLFVSVDVFFVLSGYLITWSTLRDVQSGRFSLRMFYLRRARRVLPVLFVVCLASFVAGWFIFLPEDFDSLNKSILAAAAFVPNIYFWQEVSYFSQSAETVPLLQLWTLGVEEQFYVVFPLIVLATLRFSKSVFVWVIILGTVSSFALAVALAPNYASATYFLSPTRAWQIGAGVLGALWIFYAKPEFSALARNMMVLTGTGLIVFGAVFYHSDLPYPGYYALAPVIGALGVIFAGQGPTILQPFYTFRPLVYIGTISYSLYLWHLPILAFSKYSIEGHASPAMNWALVGAGYLLAPISYHLIESPFLRRRQTLTPAQIVAMISGFLAMVGVAAFALIVDTTRWRFSPDQADFLEFYKQTKAQNIENSFSGNACFQGFDQSLIQLTAQNCITRTEQPKVVVIGDSTAAHLIPGLKMMTERDAIPLQHFTAAGCRPIQSDKTKSRCQAVMSEFLKLAETEISQQDIVLVAASWISGDYFIGEGALGDGLASTLAALRRLNLNVVVLGGGPQFVSDPFLSALKGDLFRAPDIYLPASDFLRVDRIIQGQSELQDVPFVGLASSLCTPAQCAFKLDGEYLMFDVSHLSKEGSTLIAQRRLLPVLTDWSARISPR